MNLPAYLVFVARFAIAPRATLQTYQGQNTIDPSLAFYGVVGSLVGALIVAIAVWTRQVPRRDVSEALGRIGPHLVLPPWSLIAWPIVSVAVIVSVTAIIHGFAAGWHTVRIAAGLEIFDDTLGGGWRDTANALLVANALLSPLMAIVVAAASRLSRQFEQVLYFAFTLSLFGYVVVALAGTHPNTSLGQASGVLFAPLSVPIMVLLSAGWILRTLSRLVLNIRRQR
jgi:hypothetical protein